MHDECQNCRFDHVHHVQEAGEAAPSVSKDTKMEDAELASKGVKDSDGKPVEGGSKGTKRAAEHEADVENSAGSLTLAPSAKRQKTDADWGELIVTAGSLGHTPFGTSLRCHTMLQGCCMA